MPGVAAGKAIVAQQRVVPVVENVKQVGWMPVASGPVHSVCSMEYDLN